MVASREAVYSRVEDVLVEALGGDKEEVTESATLSGDLGAATKLRPLSR